MSGRKITADLPQKLRTRTRQSQKASVNAGDAAFRKFMLDSARETGENSGARAGA
jgi:hypothetical protein